MSATLRKLLLVAPLTILFSTACFAQTTTAVEGDVKGDDGQPLKGAVIKIVRTDIKSNYNTKTDKKGHYYYGGLQAGTYRVSIEVDGKERGFQDHVVLHLQPEPQPVNFDLKAQAATAPAGGTQELTKEQERGMTNEQKAAYEKNKSVKEEAIKKNKELNDAFNAGIAGQEAAAAAQSPEDKAKQWDIAVQSFEKASTLDPNQNVVWGRLGDSYSGLAKTKTGADQEAVLAKAVDAYQKAIALKAEAPEYHNNYALALAGEKKFTEAQAELQKAAQLDPTNGGKYYYNMGAVLVNTGQLDPAGDAFKKAIELDPNYADAYYQYGITLMGKATTGSDGKMIPVPGTAEAFNKYLQLAPNGRDAETAKAMLDQIGAKIETNFAKPTTTQKKKQQ
jgi:tetratricopeptide (TPR) repeat protein